MFARVRHEKAERMLRILGLVSSLALLGALPVRVEAQSAPPGEQQLAAGNELLEAGKTAYAEGRFAEALNDFEQAYQRTQRASILYRIGDTADKLGDHERAISGFQQYLDAVPHAKEADFVRGRIAANRQALQQPQAPLAASALSPAAAAHTAEPDPGSTPKAPLDAAPSDGKDLTREWWVWAGAGTLLVATIVVVGVLVSSPSTQQVAPVKGNVGGIVQTLEGP
jgi:tetratricopeptide (TPR) repeat protein